MSTEVEEPEVEDPLAFTESEQQPEVDEMGESEREHYERIKDLNAEVMTAQRDYDIKKSVANAAKKDLELAQAELSTAIAEGPRKPDPQKQLPFSDGEGEQQDWATTSLFDVIECTAKQREKLEDVGVWTVGQFEHLRSGQKPDFPDGLRSIKGVGEATVDKWEDQMVNWLSANARESSEPE